MNAKATKIEMNYEKAVELLGHAPLLYLVAGALKDWNPFNAAVCEGAADYIRKMEGEKT